jgi:hypothetical protein
MTPQLNSSHRNASRTRRNAAAVRLHALPAGLAFFVFFVPEDHP